MKKTVFTSSAIVCLILAVFLTGLGSLAKASPESPVHNIDSGLDYVTIQAAIDAPETLDGHTILVDEGIYYENVIVNKTVSLVGEDTVIIDGNETGTVMNVTASSVNLSGFTIRQSGMHGFGVAISSSGNNFSYNVILENPKSGIVLDNSHNNTILSNYISNYGYGEIGLVMHGSDNNTISGNDISGFMSGIELVESIHNTFLNNNLTDNMFGISLDLVLGGGPSVLYNTIDVSNTVNRRPIQYVRNMSNIVYDAKTNAGTFYLINCRNITISDLTLTNNGQAIYLVNTTNTRIENVTLSDNWHGIWMTEYSVNNTIIDNRILNNMGTGIVLWSNYSTLSGNTIFGNGYGLCINGFRNTISENSVSGNYVLNLEMNRAINNTIYHNSFLFERGFYNVNSTNTWDNSLEGNYWSSYTGVDLDHDGIGDSSLTLDENNTDRYPLMGMFSDFNVTSEHHVQTICNSTIADFMYNGTAISFNVEGEEGTIGFCRTCIPRALINETYQVFVNDTEVPHTLLPCSNSTHSYLYFTYGHSTQEVVIIPEFPSFLILPLFMISTLLAVILYRRKHSM